MMMMHKIATTTTATTTNYTTASHPCMQQRGRHRLVYPSFGNKKVMDGAHKWWQSWHWARTPFKLQQWRSTQQQHAAATTSTHQASTNQ
jgi:hypothetical protein